MNAHLLEISAAVDKGSHAVLVVDQAGWHLTPKLRLPENISILPLPPRAPELNPVENVWQFMRDNWLSNRVFENNDQIVALCCEAWNKLVEQPWRIISIGKPRLGQCMLISESWYYPPRRGTHCAMQFNCRRSIIGGTGPELGILLVAMW